MPRKRPEPIEKDEYYVAVDEYVDHPDTGELMLVTPTFRTRFVTARYTAWTDENGVFYPEELSMLTPDKGQGVYHVIAASPHSGEGSLTMKAAIKRNPGKIIGPFASRQEALVAKHQARELTPREKAIRAENTIEQKESELDALRARLNELEKKAASKRKPKTGDE